MTLTASEFVAKWAASAGAERANKDSYLRDLCEVLGVDHPDPSVDDDAKNAYVFERRVSFTGAEGKREVGSIDLYKEGHFILEAKQGSVRGSKKVGTARRGTYSWDIAMNEAYGQALGYARTFEKPPPFILVADLGYCFDLYAAFDGSWDYRPFPDAQNNRLFATDFEKHKARLHGIFTDPYALDPSRLAAKVTREVAGYIADLAKQLERQKHDPEHVATFLMRCLFTMFAEDVGLLPEHTLTKALREFWIPNPASFVGGIESLWRGMDAGGDVFPFGKLLRFNGGLFKDPVALPLDKEALEVLMSAAKCTWSDVEPAIFGTLLERALDPKERHRLGAHFTPRAYVERLVKPTIEEPLREDWALVLAQVRRIGVEAEAAKSEKAAKAKKKEAVEALETFHRKLTETIVLDPACGTGNFLYVAFDIFKRLEAEVLAELAKLGETQERMYLDTVRVMPRQFKGIEIKRWAKEIAELVLWIGYLQWHFRVYGKDRAVLDPVLHDDHNIECRDAVLAYDGEPVVVTDEKGRPVTRWDGESMKKSPVTGEDVPDETKTVPIFRYENPRKAEWPKADFIVGNPPFIGNKRMRDALGDGYVEALREAWREVPGTVDFVMYWWKHAADVVAGVAARRFGLITTNSVTQAFNRTIAKSALEKCSFVFAVPDHPWVDSSDGAAVRIAMSTLQAGKADGRLLSVTTESERPNGESAIEFRQESGDIDAAFRIGAKSTALTTLQANSQIAFQGVIPLGMGFRLEPDDLVELGLNPRALPSVVRRYSIGRDLVQKSEIRFVVDFFGMSEADAAREYPKLYQRLLVTVKPERDQNKRDTRRLNWWLFGENAPAMRRAVRGLRRYIGTPDTSKFKPFFFIDSDVLPDVGIYSVACDDAFVLGVLSSECHQAWLRKIAPTLEDRPRWKPSVVWDPFPFPTVVGEARGRIGELAEAIDGHRKATQCDHPELTVTGIYNVLARVRSGESLTKKELAIHEQGLVSVLKQLHDDLDAAVFDAYGWPHDLTDEQILERLVALNAERAAEEKRGLIRWLRPEFQNPSGKAAPTQSSIADDEAEDEEPAPAAKPRKASKAKPPKAESAKAPKLPPWPKKLADQVAAVRDLVRSTSTEWSAESIAAQFKRADPEAVESVLDALTAIGQAVTYTHEGTRHYRAPASVSTHPPPRG